MSLRSPEIPAFVSPELLDAALNAVNTRLTTELTWLDNAYGNTERRHKEISDKASYYPGLYSGGKDYLNLFPDGHLGNYSFFYIGDPLELIEVKGRSYNFSARYALIFWFDYRTVYSSDWQLRSISNVQSDILAVIKKVSIPAAQISVDRIFLDAVNIYRSFSINEIEQQYLMRPYGGLRIEGILKYYDYVKC